MLADKEAVLVYRAAVGKEGVVAAGPLGVVVVADDGCTARR